MCEACKELLRDVPAKDWLVTKLTDLGPGHYYRFHLEGENLNWPEGHRERKFSWSVRDVDDPRYDLGGIVVSP
jgi:hypothetical protein